MLLYLILIIIKLELLLWIVPYVRNTFMNLLICLLKIQQPNVYENILGPDLIIDHYFI